MKKNRRNSTKHPALDPALNLKTRAHLVDFDYLDKLTEKELEWLNSFCEGNNNANMTDGAKKIFKTKASKKECYDSNNARNRCVLTRAHASGTCKSFDDLTKEERVRESEEDRIIDKLDEKLLSEKPNSNGGDPGNSGSDDS